MLEALVVTLREGVEAALAVAIVLAFLEKADRPELKRWAWAGIVAAVVASAGGAFMLARLPVNEEAFEGWMYLASALLVGSMLWWMQRSAKTLKRGMEARLERALDRGVAGSAFSVAAFTFLMVVREGIETVFFLTAVNLTTEALAAFAGGLLGLALAVAFGVAFVKGSARFDLARFFKITGIALGIFLVQLVVNGVHELSEAGVIPSSPREMAVIGPAVRHNVLFILAIVALPLAALLVPSRSKDAPLVPDADPVAANPAVARLQRATSQSARRWRVALAATGLAVAVLLGLDYVYSKVPSLSPAAPLGVREGVARIPFADLADGRLHRYAAEIEGVEVRVIAVKTNRGDYVAALDACEICGTQGYAEQGPNVVCLHCQAAIHTPSIGRGGGCNPIAVRYDIDLNGDAISITANELTTARAVFAPAAADE